MTNTIIPGRPDRPIVIDPGGRIPAGGATGQALVKASGSDYATEWVTIASVGGTAVWGGITGTLSAQTDLQAALNGKQAAGSYAAAVHTHVIGDVTGLQTALDGKANTAHTHTESIIIAVGDETTPITTGTAKVTFRMPYPFTLSAVRASLTGASSSGNPTVDINEAGASILSTKLSIDSGEKTSTTATTAAVISDSSLANDAEMTIDIDAAGTGATGLKVYLIGSQP